MVRCYLDHKVKLMTLSAFRQNRGAWDSVGVQVADKHHAMQILKPLTSDFRMIFSGAVSTMPPDKSSYILGSVFGFSFAVVGPSTFANQGCGCAWSVRKAKKNEIANMEEFQIPLNIAFDKHGNILDGKEEEIPADQIEHKFTLELLALKPTPQLCWVAGSGSALCRGPLAALHEEASNKRTATRRKGAGWSEPLVVPATEPELPGFIVEQCVGVPAALKALSSGKVASESSSRGSASSASLKGLACAKHTQK